MDSNMKTDSLDNWQKLNENLFALCNGIDANSPDGQKLIKAVLTSLVCDINVAQLLAKNKLGMEMNQVAWEDYIKHIKRTSILEIYGVSEAHIRNLVDDRKLSPKGVSQKIYEYLEKALDKCENEEAIRLIQKAQSKAKGTFVDFGTILSIFLQESVAEKRERKSWTGFFEILRLMRNASHNNFLCIQTQSVR